MTPTSQKVFRIAVLLGLVSLLAFLLAEPINLVTADLGRHLKNGEFFLENFSVPRTNFYSYTHPDFPFLNHHWLSGAIFFSVLKWAGFEGLSLFFIILSVGAFLLFFSIAAKTSNFEIASALSLLAFPLIAERAEIRPEVFSYFFAGIFFFILWNWRSGGLGKRWLFLLPIVELLWVNLHVYFILGLGILGLFLIEEVYRKRGHAKILLLVGGLTLAAAFLNPWGGEGVIYPLRIFENYGYMLFENQSIGFIRQRFFYPPARYFAVLALLLLVSWVASLRLSLKKKEPLDFPAFILSALVLAVGWFAVRNLALFAYFAIPLASLGVGRLGRASPPAGRLQTPKELASKGMVFSGALFGSILFLLFLLNPHYFQGREFGLGLKREARASSGFFKGTGARGPILNNYDIGGYLIYELYPQEPVFVDNRPEAYPAQFFKEVYIPLQENEEEWRKRKEEYNFQTIFFHRKDYTPWSQAFLIRRVSDPEWAPVYVDEDTIIFLRRGGINQKIIDRYELPKAIFRTG